MVASRVAIKEKRFVESWFYYFASTKIEVNACKYVD
jgi:hypothetical protein